LIGISAGAAVAANRNRDIAIGGTAPIDSMPAPPPTAGHGQGDFIQKDERGKAMNRIVNSRKRRRSS